MGSSEVSSIPTSQGRSGRMFGDPKTMDPALASLFASSSGPVRVPLVKFGILQEETQREAPDHANAEEYISSVSIATDSESSSSPGVSADQIKTERPRKRRRVEVDELEASYFQRLAKEEEREEQSRRAASPSFGNEPYPARFKNNADSKSLDDGADTIIKHEALTGGDNNVDKDKYQRTVFLSNVSVDAIKSKACRKLLLKHLESALDTDTEKINKAKIESIRFRSTAYSGTSGPKKAGYATKDVMEQTTKSTNAYVIFSSQAAARQVAKKLNGSIVLDRHVRIDYLANPSSTDHRRCVFVGNLNFVDEENSKDDSIPEDIQPRRARAKLPADAEEGLWRTFSKVGRVENVRVVRDKHTRVGKGFAYVQFADENSVEAALLLNEKKFPPMLPRKLRVMRAKRIRETSSKSPAKRKGSGFRSDYSKRGKSSKFPTSRGRKIGGTATEAVPTKTVFEGHRATKPSTRDAKQKTMAGR